MLLGLEPDERGTGVLFEEPLIEQVGHDLRGSLIEEGERAPALLPVGEWYSPGLQCCCQNLLRDNVPRFGRRENRHDPAG